MTNTRVTIPFFTRLVLTIAVVFASACQTTSQDRDTRPGTYLNPPKVGERITPRVGSVVCFNEQDAMAMVRTGFFTQTCSTITQDLNLIAESIERRDAGEGDVWMIQTTYENQPAWVPIPWHDWV